VQRSLTPITREATREDGVVVREFNISSAATVFAGAIGALFLVFFLAAFLPWLLSRGMTAAVEGLMGQIGFDTFEANTIWDWLLVLVIFAVFTAFVASLATGVLVLYNMVSKRTGMGLRIAPPADELGTTKRRAIAEPVDDDDEDELDDLSFDELYAEAQTKGIKGRSNMSKGELRAAVRRRRRSVGRSRTRRARAR